MSAVSSLPSDWIAPLQQMAGELAAIRAQLAAMNEAQRQLNDRNLLLQSKLEHSERARAELLAQTGRILELLGEARQELREKSSG